MSANLPAGWKHASPADHLRPNDRHGLVPITVDPDIQGGAPCIAGTRVPVSAVKAVEARGGRRAVLDAYPHLTTAQLSAALAYVPRPPTVEEARALLIADDAGDKDEARVVALDVATRHSWQVGVEARTEQARGVAAEIAGFLSRPEHVLSAAHGEALMLLSRALVVLGGGT